MRIGQGYDLHKLVPDRDLILGGVKILHETGLLGHSDADVLVHAIIDALFGAIAEGDIGQHFPDSDPQYKNANSLKLLAETGGILKNKGYKILNIDTTVVLQKPKLAPHINNMKKNIANTLNMPVTDISIKAKTNEGMDAVGRCEAIEAFAVVIVDYFL